MLEGILLAIIAVLALLLLLRAGKRNRQSPEGPEQEQEREEGPLLDVLALRGFSYLPGGEHLALWEGENLIFRRETENPFDPKQWPFCGKMGRESVICPGNTMPFRRHCWRKVFCSPGGCG